MAGTKAGNDAVLDVMEIEAGWEAVLVPPIKSLCRYYN